VARRSNQRSSRRAAPPPCHRELKGCNDNIINLAVKAAESAGIPEADIVPAYQAFRRGTHTEDGRGHWIVPTAAQETAVLNTWGPLVPVPVFDRRGSGAALDLCAETGKVFKNSTERANLS
jgi:hypothetical protein